MHTGCTRTIKTLGKRGVVLLVTLVALPVLVGVAAAQAPPPAWATDGLPPGVPVPAWAKGKRVHFDPAEPQNPRLAGDGRVASNTRTSEAEASPAALSANSMHYYGGPVENGPRLVLVFWGSGWSSRSGLEHELEATAEGLPGSGYQKILTQYSSLDGPISPDPLDSPVVEKFYDPREITSKVTGELAAREGYEVIQRTGGGSDGNATYAVLPAPGTAGVEAGTCGFHETSGREWATGPSVAVILDTEGAAGCGPPSMTLTHEYAESVTDPDGGSGWTRADSGDTEIADVCKALGPARMADGALVAQLWDDSKGACEVEDGGPGSVPIGPYAEPSSIVPSPYGWTNLTKESEKLETTIYPCGLEAHYYFEYGPTAAYGHKTAESVAPAAWGAVAVSTTVSGLQHNSPYHWRVVVRTSDGTFDGVDHDFSIAWDPEIREEGSSDVQSRQASVGGYIQPGGIATTYHIEYGPTEAYGVRTEEASAGSGDVFESVSAELNALEPGTVYHFRLVATNAHGTAFGKDSKFETHGGKPAVTSLPATNIGYTRASLTGSVYGKYITTDYYFEYGTTNAYGQRTTEREARGEERPEINTQEVDGLAPDTLYHYRIVATNRFYGTSYGADETFSTYPEPTVETDAPTVAGYHEATLSGAIDPRGVEVSYYFEYGHTETYGSRTAESGAGSGTASVQEIQNVGGLEEGATYHFRMVATSSYGTTYGTDRTFSTPVKPLVQTEMPTTGGTTTAAVVIGPGSVSNEMLAPPGPGPSPLVKDARQSTARWREDDWLARISHAKTPMGTTFSFSLNERAEVAFSFVELVGRRDGHGCVASRSGPQDRTSCDRKVLEGTLTFAGHVGTNRVVFAGRISRRHKLNPGAYELIVTATNTLGQHSAAVRLRFTILEA